MVEPSIPCQTTSNYKIKFNFVSIKQLGLDCKTAEFLKEKNIDYNVYNSIGNIINNTDVLYDQDTK